MNPVEAPLTAPAPLAIGRGDELSVGVRARARAAPWALSLGVLFVYLLFPTRNYYWDGIDFALTVEQSRGLGPALIHPHHLLYNVFGYYVYHAFEALGLQVRAVHALQAANALLSALSALLLHRFLSRTLRSTFLSATLTLLFSFSATWWKYSTDADSYVLSVLSLLVCLNLLFAARGPRPWSVALAHSAGMFMHQLAVFFYPVIVLGLLLDGRGLTRRRRLILVLQYSVAASSFTLAVNYFCFHLQTGGYGPADFVAWLTSYVQGPQAYSLGFDWREVVVHTFRGHARLFFGGRFNWLDGLLGLPVLTLLATLIAVASFLVYETFRGFKTIVSSFKSPVALDDKARWAAAACGLWACAYFAFLCFWYPYFTPYRMFYLPALVFLLGAAAVRYDLLRTPRRRRFASMFVAAMALSNFLFFIYPLSHVEKNPAVEMALGMGEAWPAGTVVYYARPNADNELFHYFNPATDWRKLDADPGGSFEETLREVYGRGGGAWLDASALDRMQSSPAGSRWLAEHSAGGRRVELVGGGYRIIFVQVMPSAAAGDAQARDVSRGGGGGLDEDTVE
ncbi:MAG: hypothetical protein JOZ96_26555 [Acidobacteria bacterium]|nr:hypothetical protein [Acidobacteriota bacterium]